MCYWLVFTFFILNIFCVFISWAYFRFNVELSLMSRAALAFTPIGFLGKLNVVIKSLIVLALGAQVYGDRALPGISDQGRISSWVIWDSEPSKSIHFGVQKKSRLNIHVAQICWKITRSLLQLVCVCVCVCVCVKTAYTCSLQGVSFCWMTVWMSIQLIIISR